MNERVEENLCPTCNVNSATSAHLCPYGEEITGDDSLCTCCDDCTAECRMLI